MRFFISLIACLWLPCAALAAPLLPEAKQLQENYARITSMRCEFTQVLLHKESGSKENRTGTLLFKKPLLVRWETKAPHPELLVVTDKVIWNAFPDEEVAYKYAPSVVQDSKNIVRVITGQARLDEDFHVENEGREGGLIKLHLYPKEPVQAMTEVLFWVDPATNLLKKFRIYDFYGNQNEITFTSVKTDVTVASGAFAYTPPKGMDIEDRTRDVNAAPKKGLLR